MKMRKKNYMIIILLISVVVFGSGFYLKFMKSHINDIQTKSINYKGEAVQRQLRLGETIVYLEELKSIADSQNFESKENDIVLKKLKTVNSISITIMILSCFAFLWSIQKIIKINRS